MDQHISIQEGSRSEDSDNHMLWMGSKVKEHTGRIVEIRSLLPNFYVKPFAIYSAGNCVINPNLYTVVQTPANQNEMEMPIGVVSKKYKLIQHYEVFDVAVNAMRSIGIDTELVEAKLTITEFGERMALSFLFPEDESYSFSIDENGDNMRLRLQCFNSVEGSARFMAFLELYRLVCSNGLMVGIAKLDFRKRHCIGWEIDDIGEVLSVGLSVITEEVELYRDWQQKELALESIRQWVDGPLKDKWGVKLAARTFHIIRTGMDAKFAKPFEKGWPSEKTMEPTRKVPGTPQEVHNVFDVSQVLSWLAKERNDVQQQIELMRDIPNMMDSLFGKVQ
jgi:hypothetical protein